MNYISDLKPDDSITSALNFYNAVTPAAIVCANKAPEPGTDAYRAQVKNLCETVSSGQPVLCFTRCGCIDGVSFQSPGSILTGVLSKGVRSMTSSFVQTRCILLTGAYTDGDGNRILIGYDGNEASYSSGEPQIYTVIGNYEDIVEDDVFGDSLGPIAWLSDASCLASFKAEGETDPSAWYSYYRLNQSALQTDQTHTVGNLFG